MGDKRVHTYDESKIKTLSSLEHIQTRPGMYIGRLGDGTHPDDGIYVLLKEVIDNSIDEFIMGHGRRIDLAVSDDGIVTVRDYGRGIPLGKVIECVSQINTGAKYNDDVFQFSVGLNGVGTKAVNALSQAFHVRAVRDGKFKSARFHDGELDDEDAGECEDENGTEVTFQPSASFFPHFTFDEKFIRRRLWHYAYLNSGLSLYYNNERFYSRNGLLDLLNERIDEDELYAVMYHKSARLEFAFCHTAAFGETFYSFVNGQYTKDGGTHESAFREGILKGINEFVGKNMDATDVRNGITGAVAVKVKEPLFESQTKNKLGNHEIRTEIVSKVKDVVFTYLHQHPETATEVVEKINRNERMRKEIQAVKKQARDKAKKTNLKIPKLRDCKFHLDRDGEKGANTMVFLTEGQSAAGSIISCRDVWTQAVFSLKGKPLNCFGMQPATVYKNEELYFIMRALGLENGMDDLRYEKVVLATDADVDGLHIRNLLITFFLTFFEQLVLTEHLFILETPLFRVRNKRETIYCYNQEERNEALAKFGKAAEITRFKGLGEISPSEFGQFIGDDIRLLPVTVDTMRAVPDILKFYMGKNTPDRRTFIMDNLTPVDV